jgi:hypothetical protein
MTTCARLGCSNPVPDYAGTGRPSKWCSTACRKAAYRTRQTEAPVGEPTDRQRLGVDKAHVFTRFGEDGGGPTGGNLVPPHKAALGSEYRPLRPSFDRALADPDDPAEAGSAELLPSGDEQTERDLFPSSDGYARNLAAYLLDLVKSGRPFTVTTIDVPRREEPDYWLHPSHDARKAASR